MELPEQSTVENDSTAATSLVVANIVRVCADRFGAALRAVVLTGSLARGEGTCVRQGEGQRLLGDADLFLIFHSGASMPREGTGFAEQAVERALAREGIVAHVSLAPVYPEFLLRMPRHIATYELRACGRVVWGDADVLSLVPQFSAADISREDAWRMLANRIIEQLEAVATDEGVFSAGSQYATAKLFLDMATSYLVFTGLYQPSYGQRARVLQEAAGDHHVDAPFPLAPFAEIVNAVTAFKLRATPMPYCPQELWADAVRYAAGLWGWQLVRLTGSSHCSSTDELMKQWVRQMPRKAQLRGWASAARRSGADPALHLSRLRLVFKGSPRYLTYAVATELFFRLPGIILKDPGAADWTALAACLPLRATPTVKPYTWQALAKSIALNYHQLLENTTA